jgi:sodium/potassium-transporting ATPase subunit alpha
MLTLRKPTSDSAIKEIGAETFVLYVKGAPDILFPRCTSYMDKNGDLQPLNSAAQAAINLSQEQLSGKGQRVLALCSRTIVLPSKVLSQDQSSEDFAASVESANGELTIVGLVITTTTALIIKVKIAYINFSTL